MKIIRTTHTNCLVLIFLLVCLLPTAAASAQDADQDPPSQCVACHQDLYIHYDTGKYFCLCNDQISCTDCHHGDPEGLTAEVAHIGMIARPACRQHNTCIDCHPAEYQERIAEFAAVAGLHATPCPLPECEQAVDTSRAAVPECSESAVIPWREIAAGLLGAGSLGLVVLAVFLYRTDTPTEGNK